MLLISNDDILLLCILTFTLVFLWDSLNRNNNNVISNNDQIINNNNNIISINKIDSSTNNSSIYKINSNTISSTTQLTSSTTVTTATNVNTSTSINSNNTSVNNNVTNIADTHNQHIKHTHHTIEKSTDNQISIESSAAVVSAEPPERPRGVVLPYLPGCEPEGAAARELQALHPEAPLEDIVRYLVARKGSVSAASEMLQKCAQWRARSFPLRRTELQPVYSSSVMFFHGTARDGTPVIYFRGGLYDKTKAAPETYVLGAAHCIDMALKHANTINVTVLVHTSAIEGGVNAPADMNFIKAFVAVLSDNYPERLKRLVLYPFPWWGRTVWSMVSMFLDKRTQEKVVLLSGDASISAPPPKELFDYVDPREIPIVCGGVDKRPIIDVLSTLPE